MFIRHGKRLSDFRFKGILQGFNHTKVVEIKVENHFEFYAESRELKSDIGLKSYSFQTMIYNITLWP